MPTSLPSSRCPIHRVDGAHRSLQILPPPFGPERARPRAVVYVHLSGEALTAGTGVARVENVGPVLLNRLRLLLGEHCTIHLKPVIDLPSGHTPIDAYEIPASLREQLQLRYPADVFPYAAAVSRSIDVDHTIPYLSPDRGGPPAKPGSATSDPTSAATTTRRRTATGRSDNQNPAPGYGDHPTARSTSSTPPAPTHSATQNSPKRSGVPPPAQSKVGWLTVPSDLRHAL